jgi:hypothetical protein
MLQHDQQAAKKGSSFYLAKKRMANRNAGKAKCGDTDTVNRYN